MAVTGDTTSHPARGSADGQNNEAGPGNLENPSTRPYTSIVERNVFNLHPPPPPVDPNELAKKNQQIPKLTLNGITTILGKKIAFITEPPPKPGTPQTTLSLSEGEAEDEVEVKGIDDKAGVVKVVNHGEEQTLDFEHDGVRPTATGSSPATPTSIPIPAMPPPNMSSRPPMRPMRNLLPNNSSANNGSADGGSGVGGGFVASSGSSANTQAPTQMVTAEQQAMIIESQRMKYIQEGNPVAKILPPTAFTQQVMDSLNGGGDGAPAPQ